MNAVIMAAGTSSRFVPLSYEKPKGLLEVKGEILIERQIRQLLEAGVDDIIIVVGYMADKFSYLREKYGVRLVLNEDYYRYNNTSSVIRVIDELSDTFLCSSDNYFPMNVFACRPSQSYYSALYADGQTKEYCLTMDGQDNIVDVQIGGADAWYMVGHVFLNKEFSSKFREILKKEYAKNETRQGYWENVYIKHIQDLPPMRIHRYTPNDIFEFDTLDELREFDSSYWDNTRSILLKYICEVQGWKESDLHGFEKTKVADNAKVFFFKVGDVQYLYDSSSENNIRKV